MKKVRVFELAKEYGMELYSIQSWHLAVIYRGTRLDIYPQKMKYHNVREDKRGQYKDLVPFVKSVFKIEDGNIS